MAKRKEDNTHGKDVSALSQNIFQGILFSLFTLL